MSVTALSEVNYSLHPVVSEITFDDDLDVAVISCTFNAVMNGSQSETDIVDIEIAVARVLSVNDLYGASLLRITSAVNDKEIPSREDKLVKSLHGSLVV